MTRSEDRPTASARRGSDTRRRAQRAALALFTGQGYDATSLRQIADELGINKASLYHHFASKEAILQSLVDDRGTEAEELLDWLRAQPRRPDLLEETVLRWVDTFTTDKLAGIRFAAANPLVLRRLAASGATSIGQPLEAIAEELTRLVPEGRAEDAVLVRMAITSINAAVQATAQTDVADDDVVAAARRCALALVHEIRGVR
jgi:AcrR family transcriptional regulator